MRKHKILPRLILLLVLAVLSVQLPVQVYALSEAQRKALDSGIYYFDPEGSSSLCTVSTDVDLNGSGGPQIAFNFFAQKGLTTTQSAGAVGNLMQESHVDPTIQQDGSSDPFPKPGVGFGIAQWTISSRQQNLTQYAQQNNKPVTDLGLQLEFLWHELTNSYPGAYSELKSATTIEDATEVFMEGYEAPGDPQLANRITYARQIYRQYGGSTGGVVTIPASEEEGCSVITGPGQDTRYIDGFTVYSQYDPQWINAPYSTSTIGDSGCGPAAMAMIITALRGQRVTPVQTANYAALKGMYIPDQGSKWTIAPVLAERWGLKSKHIGTDAAKITQVLQAGGLVITAGEGPKPFTKGGHFIVLRGVTSEGKWKVGDSGHRDTSDKEWDPQQLLSSMKDGSVYAITQ